MVRRYVPPGAADLLSANLLLGRIGNSVGIVVQLLRAAARRDPAKSSGCACCVLGMIRIRCLHMVELLFDKTRRRLPRDHHARPSRHKT